MDLVRFFGANAMKLLILKPDIPDTNAATAIGDQWNTRLLTDEVLVPITRPLQPRVERWAGLLERSSR